MSYHTKIGKESHAIRIVNRVKVYCDYDFIKSIEAELIPHQLDYKVYIKLVIDESKYLMNLLQENPITLDNIKEFIEEIDDERHVF